MRIVPKTASEWPDYRSVSYEFPGVEPVCEVPPGLLRNDLGLDTKPWALLLVLLSFDWTTDEDDFDRYDSHGITSEFLCERIRINRANLSRTLKPLIERGFVTVQRRSGLTSMYEVDRGAIVDALTKGGE